MLRKKTRTVHPAVVAVVIAAIVGLGILWTIRATQEAIKITDSIAEDAEDQTGQISAKPDTNTNANEMPGTETVTMPYPKIISENEVTSITVVVNKKHKLPTDYVPKLVSIFSGKMRPEAAEALELLFASAKTAGLNPLLVSSYRSYAMQEQVYNGYVNQNGQTEADTFSARPGHSEHQTGLAVDVDDGSGCQLETCFGNTELGKWLSTNAQKYGYIIRYQEGKDSLTGYQYEPWHIRYVGTDVATAIYKSGQTLDEYFKIEAGSY